MAHRDHCAYLRVEYSDGDHHAGPHVTQRVPPDGPLRGQGKVHREAHQEVSLFSF
jgi:hypothetical protein